MPGLHACVKRLSLLQLANGQVVEVPPGLIKRLKSHFTPLGSTGVLYARLQVQVQ